MAKLCFANKKNKNSIMIIRITGPVVNQSSATIPADVRERIIAAAADLFEQSGRQAMPTVDAVRRSARVDMNAARNAATRIPKSPGGSTSTIIIG